MSVTSFDPDLLERVSARQRDGANPGVSAWVSASAGAGKTRSRVWRRSGCSA